MSDPEKRRQLPAYDPFADPIFIAWQRGQREKPANVAVPRYEELPHAEQRISSRTHRTWRELDEYLRVKHHCATTAYGARYKVISLGDFHRGSGSEFATWDADSNPPRRPGVNDGTSSDAFKRRLQITRQRFQNG